MGGVHDMIEIPDGSIYFEMYKWGLKHVPIEEIEDACRMAGKEIRQKDYENYRNGWYRSDLYGRSDSLFDLTLQHRPQAASKNYFEKDYHDYPEHPYSDMGDEILNRYIPCNAANKPMIKWGNGCMTKEDAEAMPGQVYLAENLKGCKFIVIDCDGDHDPNKLDFESMKFLNPYRKITHALSKPKMWCSIPTSFHLTFAVDRVIPTMHFNKAHIDICGNKENQLRYFKTKIWNHLDPIPMTDEIWASIREYIRKREEA